MSQVRQPSLTCLRREDVRASLEGALVDGRVLPLTPSAPPRQPPYTPDAAAGQPSRLHTPPGVGRFGQPVGLLCSPTAHTRSGGSISLASPCARGRRHTRKREWWLFASLARRTRTPDQSYSQKGGARPSAQWEANQPPFLRMETRSARTLGLIQAAPYEGTS